MLLASGPYWRLVPVAQGQAVFYAHTTTSADAEIDPYAVPFLALQGDWDRKPYKVLVKVDNILQWASRRDVTRSDYAAELSPALCDALGLSYGWNRGVAYGKWMTTIYRIVRVDG